MKNRIKEELKKGVKEVFDGNISLYSDGYNCMGSLIDICESLGATHNEDFDSNGWEADMWDSVTYMGKKYGLSACGYYGGVSIRLAEEDDDYND